ncbi:hypothetical protein [Salidesulfovibrio onnuriiensis]|uniref:hypothetical protein n=1 Tax=Salidesulfovibrio onnuriiensis TaxID=2583823 RepID=UPI0011C8F896|nr:hypothetical protein [Salidesulfovibrio onnuriiensis]
MLLQANVEKFQMREKVTKKAAGQNKSMRRPFLEEAEKAHSMTTSEKQDLTPGHIQLACHSPTGHMLMQDSISTPIENIQNYNNLECGIKKRMALPPGKDRKSGPYHYHNGSVLLNGWSKNLAWTLKRLFS